MTRDPARIDPILADLRRYWHAAPDLRLGQMVMGLLDLSGAPRYGEFHAEDDKVAAYLAAWAAANPPPPDHRDTLPPEIEAAIAAAAWTVAELDRRADVMAQPEIADLRTAITSALAAAREAGRREALEGAAGVEEAIADYTEAAIMARPHASGHVLTAAGDDLRAAIAADKAALDATWRAHDLERDAEVAQAQAATHEACAALQAICAALHVTPPTGSTYCTEAVTMVVERVAADKARAVEAASAGRHLCDLAGCDAPVTRIEKAAVVVNRDGATGRQDIWTCEEHADVGAVLLRPVLSAEDAARLVGDFNASPYDGSNDCPARAALLAALTGACGAYGIDPGGPVADAPANVARRPVAGWKRPRSNRWTLDVGYLRATVDVLGDGRIVWRVSYFTDDAEHVKASSADDGAAYSVTTASIAAEDALRAVLVDAAAALGLRVVPS